MAAPILAKVLPYLIKAGGFASFTGLQQASASAPAKIQRWGRAAGINTERYIEGLRRKAGIDPETWKQARHNLLVETPEHLRGLLPELEGLADVTGEAKRALGEFLREPLTGSITGLLRMARAADRASVAIIEMQSVLAEYSSAHASALAELEVSRIQRSVEMGRTTGPSFRRLARSRAAYEEAMLPFRQTAAIVSEQVVATVLDAMTMALRLIDRMEKVTEIIEFLFSRGDDEIAGTAEPFMDLLGEGLGVPKERRRRRY